MHLHLLLEIGVLYSVIVSIVVAAVVSICSVWVNGNRCHGVASVELLDDSIQLLKTVL